MRKKEQKLWDRMRHCLKDKVYLERIENVVSPGRPDVDAMWEGVILPIELKALEAYPKRPSTPTLGRRGLNLNQMNWWLNWRRWGGSGFIVVGVEMDLFAVPGVFADEVNSFTKDQLWEYKVSWVQLIQEIRKEIECLRNQ